MIFPTKNAPAQRRRTTGDGRALKIEWKVTAIVENDSVTFAANLQDELERSTQDGFILQHMFQRPTDNGTVLVQQRTTLEDLPGEFGGPVPEGKA
jgi:hypothetical protein